MLNYLPIHPRPKDGLIAGTLAAFVSLIVLFVVLATLLLATGADEFALVFALIVVGVGVLFVPIASVLGSILAAGDVVRAAWLVGPLAGAAIGSWIANGEEPDTLLVFIGIGVAFGLVNAAAYVEIIKSRMRRARTAAAVTSVGSEAEYLWSKGTTGEQPQNAEPEGVGQPCGPS